LIISEKGRNPAISLPKSLKFWKSSKQNPQKGRLLASWLQLLGSHKNPEKIFILISFRHIISLSPILIYSFALNYLKI